MPVLILPKQKKRTATELDWRSVVASEPPAAPSAPPATVSGFPATASVPPVPPMPPSTASVQAAVEARVAGAGELILHGSHSSLQPLWSCRVASVWVLGGLLPSTFREPSLNLPCAFPEPSLNLP